MKANRFRFRAWSSISGMHVVDEDEPPPEFQHESFVLMQSTGLCDKDGKEIFEGDIVLADREEFVVEYCQKIAGMLCRSITPIHERAFRFPHFTHYSLCEVSGVVVGNVYERGIA